MTQNVKWIFRLDPFSGQIRESFYFFSLFTSPVVVRIEIMHMAYLLSQCYNFHHDIRLQEYFRTWNLADSYWLHYELDAKKKRKKNVIIFLFDLYLAYKCDT